MKHYPSISIAIPTLNEEHNIGRCISSILRQKYHGKLEILVVDGGSTDQTIRIAKTYPVRILSNPMKEAEYGKKIALIKSTGMYFMILDCDMELVGEHWFEKMVTPLEENSTIVGSWSRFVSKAKDAPLNKYITFDPIQRDPLFIYLTPSIDACVTQKNDRYWTVSYAKDMLLPAGFCLYRKKQILKTVIKSMKKYMELDNLVILLIAGERRYAFVQGIGIHHPFLTTIGNLVRKRVRNLNTMYFNQPDKRYWTWIDWQKPKDKLKIIIWLLYCYSIVPPILVGVWKCIKYQNISGMYELPFNLVTTSAAVVTFLRNPAGRNLIGVFINKFKLT